MYKVQGLAVNELIETSCDEFFFCVCVLEISHGVGVDQHVHACLGCTSSRVRPGVYLHSVYTRTRITNSEIQKMLEGTRRFETMEEEL
jgi:hypothetical protein